MTCKCSKKDRAEGHKLTCAQGKHACVQCGNTFQFYWLKDGLCNGCRSPHLIVEDKPCPPDCQMLCCRGAHGD
jgi:hypothetical protein